MRRVQGGCGVKIKLKELIGEQYYKIEKNAIKVSHNKKINPYVWLKFDENNVVIGNYCSSSLYENRTFDNVNLGDEILDLTDLKEI